VTFAAWPSRGLGYVARDVTQRRIAPVVGAVRPSLAVIVSVRRAGDQPGTASVRAASPSWVPRRAVQDAERRNASVHAGRRSEVSPATARLVRARGNTRASAGRRSEALPSAALHAGRRSASARAGRRTGAATSSVRRAAVSPGPAQNAVRPSGARASYAPHARPRSVPV
jgi:hypothetical protein